jgi:hypothetical protein
MTWYSQTYKDWRCGLQHLGSLPGGLKARMETAQGFEKMNEISSLDQLRYKDLEDRLRQLSHENPSIRHNMRNEFQKLSCDLSGAIDEFIIWDYSNYQRDEKGRLFRVVMEPRTSLSRTTGGEEAFHV